MPTLLEATGVPVPARFTLDGRSFLRLLEGRGQDWPDRTLFLQAHRGDGPSPLHNIALRTQRWKWVHPTGFNRDSLPADMPFEL
jgi:arylsulfatase A-like enzyme